MTWDAIKEAWPLIALALAGWNYLIQQKLREIGALFRWKDQFLKDYAADQLRMVEKFCTREEVQRGIEKLETHIDSLAKKIDRLLLDRHRDE